MTDVDDAPATAQECARERRCGRRGPRMTVAPAVAALLAGTPEIGTQEQAFPFVTVGRLTLVLFPAGT
jgi:hypothetical protein